MTEYSDLGILYLHPAIIIQLLLPMLRFFLIELLYMKQLNEFNTKFAKLQNC